MGRARHAGRSVTVAAVFALSVACHAAPPEAPSPPSALEGRVVKGQGALIDDWRDEPWLVTGKTPPSDLVGLWQAVLWADGYLARSRIDCAYDTATAEATRVWQSNHGLRADGIVGPVTYGYAGRRLASMPPWTVYRGEARDLPLRRDTGGVYEVYDAGRFRALRRDRVTLALCRAR